MLPSIGSPAPATLPWFLAMPPTPSDEMVERPELNTLLEHSVAAHRATVVCAPSGFGKTVAVSQWVAGRPSQHPGSVSWLTLTEKIVDADDVMRGVVTALQRAARERNDSMQYRMLASALDAASAVAVLAKIESEDPVTVVIDDFHHARDVMGAPFFRRFIEQGPPWLRLVLITTEAIPPGFARLRLHGHIGVVGSSEFLMAAAVIRQMAERLGHPVTTAQARAILGSTGGWAGAIRLALVGGDERSSTIDVNLTEYISSAVLRRLRPQLAEFVLNSTVSSRLDDHLAAALSEDDDWAQLLAECVAAGLFIERYANGEHTVYQWHSMFTLHCRRILRQRDGHRWRRLNRVAAVELARRYPLIALDHAIQADDERLASAIINDHWLELLLQSQSESLDRACISAMTAFGEEPELLMIRACCRDLAGDTAGAALLFARAQEVDESESHSVRMDFLADLTTVLLTDDRDAMVAAVDRAQVALADRTLVTANVYACALFLLGWADSRLRRGERGAALLKAAEYECRALGLIELSERARQNLAFASAAAGDFDQAMSLIDGAQTGTDDHQPDLWLAHDGDGIETLTRGYVRLWRGDLMAARDDFLAMHAAIGSGYPDLGRMLLALSVATLADLDHAAVATTAVALIPDGESHGVPWGSYKLTANARLAELRRDREGALRLAAQLAEADHVPMMSAIGSGICRRLGHPALARQLANKVKDCQTQPYSRSYGLLTLALLEWEIGNGVEAQHVLETCLSVAAPQQVRYPFTDNSDPGCLQLLAAHASGTAYREFLNECIAVSDAAQVRRDAGNANALTRREREVLAFLRTPMTSKEIAAQLMISVNTLKTHQRSIYHKLGASNRREAVRLAGR